MTLTFFKPLMIPPQLKVLLSLHKSYYGLPKTLTFKMKLSNKYKCIFGPFLGFFR